MQENAHADERNISTAEVVRPIYSTSDRIVMTEQQAERIRQSLARNAVVRDPVIFRRSPTFYETITNMTG